MSNKEINALETRFKATALLLMQCNMLTGVLEQNLTYAQQAFDTREFELSKKCLDLLDYEVVSLLEIV